MKRCTVILFELVILLFSATFKAFAASIFAVQAESVVKNWLVRLDPTVALRFS